MNVFKGLMNKFLLPLMLLLTLTSCNQEEFFEKEFLEGAGVERPDDDLNDDEYEEEEEESEGPSEEAPTTPPIVVTPPPAPRPEAPAIQVDSFTGKESREASKVDILWVVDDSGSMRDEQEDLARNFDVFIKDFLEQKIDFQMGITTTDARNNGKRGVISAYIK